jgi:hypothetical protein
MLAAKLAMDQQVGQPARDQRNQSRDGSYTQAEPEGNQLTAIYGFPIIASRFDFHHGTLAFRLCHLTSRHWKNNRHGDAFSAPNGSR